MGGYERLIEILNRQRKRQEIGVPLNCKLLISVGELSVRKNHKVVVEALQSLPEDYWYVIVGKGELKDELGRMDRTGRLKLLGFRTDIVDLLHSSDLFVFPSLQEGLPVALMEAMAAGVPCVASDIRGNTDLINTEVGAIVSNNISDGWVKSIEEVTNDHGILDKSNECINKIKQFNRNVVDNSMVIIYGLP